MSDRNEILANYQACTGVDDIGECMVVLEEHAWDLQSSVTATLGIQQNVHPITNGSSFQFNSEVGFNQTVMQTYSCQLGSMSKEVTLDDSNTVGDLKEIAAIQLGIPLAEMQFERWPLQCAIAAPSDHTVLRTLQLPHYNVLQVKSHVDLPGVTIGYDCTDQSPLVVPCSALRTSDAYTDVGDLTRECKLEITNKDNNQKHSLVCDGVKTVQELRQDVIRMTGIMYKNQEWNGFPGSNPPDEYSTLASLNLNHPVHALSVQSKVHAFDSSINLPNNHIIDIAPQPLTMDPASISDDEYDLPLDDDMFSGATAKSTSNAQLMPNQVDDVKGALSQLQVEFCNRYGIGPHFVADTLQAAIQKAFGAEARKRKLLAVYIHHDQSIQSNVFCSQILCDDSIVACLNEQFVCWAWDITSDTNRNRLLQECSQFLGTGVADTIRRMKKDEFPLLVLAQGKGRSCDVTAIMQGNTELNEVLSKLWKAVDDSEMQKGQDIREEDARNARERIKQEQEEAYRRSLEQDRAKMMKQAQEAKKLDDEEKEKREAEHRQQEEVSRLQTLLPQEPDTKCGQPLTQLDRSKSLEDHKFHPQEALIIEEGHEEES